MIRKFLASVAVVVMTLAIGRAAEEIPKPPAGRKADAAWEYKAVRLGSEEDGATKRINELASEDGSTSAGWRTVWSRSSGGRVRPAPAAAPAVVAW